jgi:hypothetical protein
MKTVQDAYEDHCGVWPEVWNKQYNKTKDYLALCWSNCRGRWYGVFLGDELSDVVCTKQQFIDYGNSLKEERLNEYEQNLRELKARIYDETFSNKKEKNNLCKIVNVKVVLPGSVKDMKIDYTLSDGDKDKEMESKTVVFKGYELEIGKIYITESGAGRLIRCTLDSITLAELGSDVEFDVLNVGCIHEIDAGKITRAKITPKGGRIYKCKDVAYGTITYLDGNRINECNRGAERLEIICEMVEKE